MPHGYCYLWNPGLVWLHVISDSLIAVAYFTIPFMLLWLVRKRRDLPFNWMFVMFGVFIVACGATHVMEIWNLWHAEYWLAGVVKAITAAASVGTAILLAQLVPRAAKLPDVNQWIRANAALESEIHERRELEIDLRISEARYREHAELLDLTHDAIFVRNLKSEILYWNRAAELLYGWTAEESPRKNQPRSPANCFPQSAFNLDAEILEKGFWEGELTHTRRDGSKAIVSSRQALRTDADGKPLSILESNRDVTQRKQEEDKFRNLLESAPDAIVIVDSQRDRFNSSTRKRKSYSVIRAKNSSACRWRCWCRSVFTASTPAIARSMHTLPSRARWAQVWSFTGTAKMAANFRSRSASALWKPRRHLISSSIRDITERKHAESMFRNLLESAHRRHGDR